MPLEVSDRLVSNRAITTRTCEARNDALESARSSLCRAHWR